MKWMKGKNYIQNQIVNKKINYCCPIKIGID